MADSTPSGPRPWIQSGGSLEGSRPADRPGSLARAGAIILRLIADHRANTSRLAVLNRRERAREDARYLLISARGTNCRNCKKYGGHKRLHWRPTFQFGLFPQSRRPSSPPALPVSVSARPARDPQRRPSPFPRRRGDDPIW